MGEKTALVKICSDIIAKKGLNMVKIAFNIAKDKIYCIFIKSLKQSQIRQRRNSYYERKKDFIYQSIC